MAALDVAVTPIVPFKCTPVAPPATPLNEILGGWFSQNFFHFFFFSSFFFLFFFLLQAMDGDTCIGGIVCKLDMHRGISRGYIAMLVVETSYRKLGLGL